MEYKFNEIEKKWQEKWKADKAYTVSNDSLKPKYYVLDMFPYPSGAGLHVGHPLGYIASDIYSRYKRLKGFNVLHPMGFDSFGLPAEQYAIETGQHPAETTKNNIATFKAQLDKIGFCYDWDREVKTSNPNYYRWTQFIFLQIFDSWYNRATNKAERIATLTDIFSLEGNKNNVCPGDKTIVFTEDEWNAFDDKEEQEILMAYRLTFCAYGEVNWCEALGTVLANDEVVNGVSERGGYKVEKKKMRQWYLRITEYADRLLSGLETVDFSDAMKEMQKNWIGKSQGAEMAFKIDGSTLDVSVYTTRPDTIFGVDFLVLAPEHELVAHITSAEQKTEIEKYLIYVKSRSERERLSEVKQITGCFTGAYAINPFNGKLIPIWIAEYVLAGYGTGAIMAVPCGDQRDFGFAKHFNIPITNIIGDYFNGEEANPTKEATLQNSGFLNGLLMKDAIGIANNKIEALGLGKRQINYRMRDAGFSRQRYWGEPFPIIWSDGIAIPLDAEELPLELPHVDKYGPGPEGEGPLANIEDWVYLTPSPSPKERGAQPFGARGAGYVYSTSSEWNTTIPFAKDNRKNLTESEAVIWHAVRNRKIDGFKFRRQHPIAGYIPDFVCLDKKLIIEIDGGYYEEEEQKKFDASRQNWLAENGFEMIRFTNEEVENNLDEVVKKITDKLKEAKVAIESEVKHINPEGLHSPLPWRGAGGEVKRETSTMPGYAGSSWYFLRYMDPHNAVEFCDRKASDYWGQVDIYIGGTEHAVGHLLYSRMWTKILFDLGYIGHEEPFKKLVNQGMITGISIFIARTTYASRKNPKEKIVLITTNDNVSFIEEDGFTPKIITIENQEYQYENHTEHRIPTHYTNGVSKIYYNDFLKLVDDNYFKSVFPEVDSENIKNKILFRSDSTGDFIFGKLEVEKMSKSKYNVTNPTDIINKFGADTFRMYEMFLGPVEQSKPWDTKGIEGVHRFLRKLWRLFFDDIKGKVWNDEKATDAELKILHRTIKKIEEDTERFSFNTAVSTFMICVNELADIKCHKKEVLENVLILLTPYAPHIAEELWAALGNDGSVLDAVYPKFDSKYLVELSKEYPISINGKVRANINMALDLQQADVEKIILQNEIIQKWLEGKDPKKIIYVKNKMVNVVV